MEAGDKIGTAKGTSERSELGKRAQAVARRVSESKATIPHLYLSRTAVLSDPAQGSAAALAAAAGRALAAHPGLNGAYRDGGIEVHSRANIGLSVETGDGPLVPTLFDADKKSVDELTREIDELGAGARAGSLASPAYSGGTFTLSVLESGADSAYAPVTPGQAAHLCVGRVHRAAIAGEDDAVAAADVIELGLSCDARAVRPPTAAEFLETLAALIGDSAGY